VTRATFATLDLTTCCRLDELGLVSVGQCLVPDRAVLECRVVVRMSGAGAAARRTRKGTPLRVRWRVSRSGTD
jgi:hypothetical protein